MRNKQRALHKQRVKLFKKMKGNYWRVEYRSTRHMKQLILAAKDAGYVTSYVVPNNPRRYTLCMYEDNTLSAYGHDCGIKKATFTV